MNNPTAEQLRAIHDMTNGNVFDADWDGGTWMFDAVETAETLDQFVESSNGYSERQTVQRGTFAGLPCVNFGQVQIRKGAPRRDLAVIDFGEVRIAIDYNLREWLA